MTITYPRDMLEIDGVLPFNALEFVPQYMQTRGVSRGAKGQVANLGPDLWAAAFATRDMPNAEALVYQAWLHSLDGGARLFKMWHPLLRYPQAYPTGFGGLTRSAGGAFDGIAVVTAVGAQRDTITIGTLPNGFVLNIGDMVSVDIGGTSRALLRLLEATTANGSGVATLTVRPTVPIGIAADAAVTFLKPWCFGQLVADSVSGPFDVGQHGRVQFSATQVY